MDESLTFKAVLRRASVVFAGSLIVLAIGAGLTWFLHARNVQQCTTEELNTRELASCHHQFWFFYPSWAEAMALLLFHFGLCMLAAWVWPVMRRWWTR